MSFDNVKVLIRDKNDYYLVGKRYDSDYLYSMIGGGREGNESEGDTLNRELFEETGKVLDIISRDGKYYLNDGKSKQPISMKLIEKKQKGKKIIILFEIDSDNRQIRRLSDYVMAWNEWMKLNQDKMIFQELNYISRAYPQLSYMQILEWFLKFRNNYDDSGFEKLLINQGFSKSQINSIKNRIQNLGYYLEMDELLAVPKKELEHRNSFYSRERDLLETLEKF
jgi:hypothetical protein